jgi:hypothetical protein
MEDIMKGKVLWDFPGWLILDHASVLYYHLSLFSDLIEDFRPNFLLPVS